MSIRIRAAVAAASVAVAVGLAGCSAGTGADLTAGQAEAFRSHVVAIADTSARGEYANALAGLEALEAELEQAVAEGELDGEREQRIRDAISLVRADLEAAIATIAPEPEPAPEPAPAPAPGDDDDDDDDSGPGNSDEGKDKGKGKDKD